MSDDAQLRLLLRQLYESAEAGVKPPGAEAAGRTLRRRARRNRGGAIAMAVVLLVCGFAVFRSRDRVNNVPIDVPTSGPVQTVSPSGSPPSSPSASPQVAGAPVTCPFPGATRADGPGVFYVIWSPQTDLPPQCQNRPTPVLVAYYRMNQDQSGVLDNASRYVLDRQHPKITVTADLPNCDARAIYVVVGDVQPLPTVPNVNVDPTPYDRRGVSYSFWHLGGPVNMTCPWPPPSPTASPSPSPSP
jgi:hypothetical protein